MAKKRVTSGCLAKLQCCDKMDFLLSVTEEANGQGLQLFVIKKVRVVS